MSNVKLVWVTPGADALLAYMARVSSPSNQANTETAARLIAYLIKHRHWSPFEMVSMCLEITTQRDVSRQLLRHRSFSFQEFSQRYASVDELPAAPLREARMQDTKNRQNSTLCQDVALSTWWAEAQSVARDWAEIAYKSALERGIAKEVARSVLPEGLTSTRLYMAGTLRSWLHFCDSRMGPGTQKETRIVAASAFECLNDVCPHTVEAWEITHSS